MFNQHRRDEMAARTAVSCRGLAASEGRPGLSARVQVRSDIRRVESGPNRNPLISPATLSHIATGSGRFTTVDTTPVLWP